MLKNLKGLYFHLLILFFNPVIWFSVESLAQYPAAKLNANLREEVEASPDRLIPLTEHFAFAVDGDAYYRNLGPDDFYHGIGYWLQARSEARLSPWARVNVRSILYAGSCSEGYAAPSGSYHLFALTATPEPPLFGGGFTIRLGDLDRQTFGEGLLIQNKEMNGGLLRWQNEKHGVQFRIDGTGMLRKTDDTIAGELWLFNSAIGAGSVHWLQGVAEDLLPQPRDPYWYIFSRAKFDWFSYGAEYGARAGASAALIALKADREFDSFSASLKLEGRRYEKDFAKDFAGKIQQQYISYDQYDKDYTDTMNIFVIGDDVNVAAVHLHLKWRVSDVWRLHSLNEAGQFNFNNSNKIEYYYFRQGVEYCPIAERSDCLNIFVSNKTLLDSYARPPSLTSVSNAALFRAVPFVGTEARFRF